MSGAIRESADGRHPERDGRPFRITEMLVVIPANDEEDRIGQCLASVERAREMLARRADAPSVRVIVVLDACVDATASVVAGTAGVHALEVSFRSVGRARDHGIRWGLATSATKDPARMWIANTDADSSVPIDWLASQLALADEGADASLGAIAPCEADLSDERYAAWVGRSRTDDREHVHGANLGVRADEYAAAGGFPDLREHEDRALVETLRARGARLVVGGSRVTTSARTIGRTPGGYAEFVRSNY